VTRSVSIEIGDLEYEIEVESFDFGQEPRGWDPGAGAEIELSDTVKVWGMDISHEGPGGFSAVPGVIDKITLDEFVDLFAADRGIRKMSDSNTRAAARAQLEELCLENLRDQMEDEYDDSDV
jgi:hypothetical protein